MSREDVEKHIQEQMEEPTEINAEDLSPPICTWCGDELGQDVEIVTWDIPEHNNESVVYRYRYCSEECQSADENAILTGEEMHPNGEPERLTEDDREMMTDGGVDQDAAEVGHGTDGTKRVVCVCDACNKEWEPDVADPEKAVAVHNQVAHDKEQIAYCRSVDTDTERSKESDAS